MAAVGSKPQGTRAALSKHTPFLFSHPKKNERMQMKREGGGKKRVEPRLSLHHVVNLLCLFFPPPTHVFHLSWKACVRHAGEKKEVVPAQNRKNQKYATDTWQIKGGGRATLLHKKICTASRSETRERKHAVSKRDRMREWKIPLRGENRGRLPPSRHPIRTEKSIKRSPNAAPT